MNKKIEIVSIKENKILLKIRKAQFISLRYSSNYSKLNAFNLSLLASAAYKSEREIKHFLFEENSPNQRNWNFTKTGNVSSCFLYDTPGYLDNWESIVELHIEPATDTQYFSVITEKYLLISIRGTEPNLKDLSNDFYSSRVDFKEGKGKVHAGFYKSFISIFKSLDEVANSTGDLPIILCGHSLGGAVATMVACYFTTKYKRKIMLYTFGSPLVGDAEFMYHYTHVEPFTYFRCIHNQDLVPLVPPPYANLRIKILLLSLVDPVLLIPATFDPWGKPFTHLGKPVFLRRLDKNSFSVDVDRKTPWYYRVPNSSLIQESRPFWDFILNLAMVSVNDHFMENYISILASDLKNSIDFYLHSSGKASESQEKIEEYLNEEISELSNQNQKMEQEMLNSMGGNVVADATASDSYRNSHLSPTEKMHLVSEALRNKQMEIIHLRAAKIAVKTPGYSEILLLEITDLPMTPALRREFEYQVKNLVY